jgi:hypothetical protein
MPTKNNGKMALPTPNKSQIRSRIILLERVRGPNLIYKAHSCETVLKHYNEPTQNTALPVEIVQ